MDSGPLLKFYGYFPDCLSVLSRTLLRRFWTTFAETAVYKNGESLECDTTLTVVSHC